MANLEKVDHIVVLMMENRSFDHMLGYLSLEGNRADVDGLRSGDSNSDENGNAVAVHPLASTFFGNDPGHGWDDVTVQLGGGNAGFVRDFAKKLVSDAQSLPPRITTIHDQAKLNGGDSRTVTFRPAQ